MVNPRQSLLPSPLRNLASPACGNCSRMSGVNFARAAFMRIAYLINQYPTISHSFIRREILALERQGHKVLRISLRGWDGAQRGKEDQLEQTRTRYVLRGGAVPLLF